MNRLNPEIGTLYLAFEFFVLCLCILVAFFLGNVVDMPSDLNRAVGLFFYAPYVIIVWFFITMMHGDPQFYFTYSFRRRIKYVFQNTLMMIGLSLTLAMCFKLDLLKGKALVFTFFLFSFLNLFLFRFVFEFFIRRKHHAVKSNILVVSSMQKIKQLNRFMVQMKQKQYSIIGFLMDDHYGRQVQLEGFNWLGGMSDLSSVLDTNPVDEIFVAGNPLKKEKVEQLMEEADYRGIRLNVIPEQLDPTGVHFKSYDMDGLHILQYRRTPLDNFNNFLMKRLFDFVFSAGVLLFLSPFFLLIAILIKIDSRGPIFYSPHRKGERGGMFKCHKFRTMSECDDPLTGKKSTVKNDPRITNIGRFLRKYGIDEMPQFFNVLKGDLSVVGPRPHRGHLHEDFRKVVNDYMVRHYVKPGITGWAQVNGWRGPAVTTEQKEARIRHDIWYIENWSFWLDIKIIFRTVFDKNVWKDAF